MRRFPLRRVQLSLGVSVRFANFCDQDKCIVLMRNFYNAGHEKTDFKFPFDAVYASKVFTEHLFNDDACCIVLEVGGRPRGIMLAYSCLHRFTPAKVSEETLWWIDEEMRGIKQANAMIDFYVEWARLSGCVYSFMASLKGGAEVERLYERKGFHLAESHFMKVL